MFSFDEEFGDLPEVDCPSDILDGLAFDGLHQQVVRGGASDVEMVVDDAVVDVLSTAPEPVLGVLGSNAVVRVPMSERRSFDLDFENDVLRVEGGGVIEGKLNMLRWLKKNNKSGMREVVFQYYGEFLYEAYNSVGEEMLYWYRLLRSVTPVLDIVTKKTDVMAMGLTTLAKIRVPLERAVELGAPDSVVAFGVGNNRHYMCYHPYIRICVDTDAKIVPGEENYFLLGNLLDWKEFVQPGDMILSDCSVTDENGMGLGIPDEFYRVYEEMVKAGYYVLCKINKLGYPFKVNWRVAEIVYYREHNLEAFVLISPQKHQNIYALQDFDFQDMMRNANESRMKMILKRKGTALQPVRLGVTERELHKALNFGSCVMNARGYKKFSVIRDVFDRYRRDNTREWKSMIYDRNIKVLDFEEKLHLDIDYPCILMDVEFLSSDKERLMASFFWYCTMEFDSDVGWVAIEKKKD